MRKRTPPWARPLTRLTAFLLVCGGASQSFAQTFPADATWVPLTKLNPMTMVAEPITDPQGDAQNSRDIVGDLTHPLAYVHRDATHQYFRVRVDVSTLQSATNFAPFGWGCVLDTDLDATDYELSVLVNGVSNPDEVRLWENSIQQTLNDPGDNPETLLQTYVDPLDNTPPLSMGSGYAREASAGTVFPVGTPDPDFFIDWAVEVSALQAAGVGDNTPLRIACGSANNGTFLSADYSGPADLTTLLSDPVVCNASGCIPQNCAGFGTACSAGVGACQASGVVVCLTGGVSMCNAVAGMPTAETCDNIDNNCDGAVDEGNPGSGAACSTGLFGICDQGTTSCVAGILACVPAVMPGAVAETCDGVDEDCDGSADNGFNVGMACSVGVGACAASGVLVCSGGAAVCDGTPGMPTAEMCGDAIDSDCDGNLSNGCPDDTDGDGLSNDNEVQIGTDPNDADSDDDGVPDGLEPQPGVDTDGDGLINALDPDADNDGLFDGTELGLGCSDPATDPTSFTCSPDGDGGATTTDPLDPDTDDGGASDGSEDKNGDGTVDPGETDPTLGNGADDSSIVDTDGDGLGDEVEIVLGSDPRDGDSDNDGVPDGQEPNPTEDTDGDGVINVLDPDSDGDGLFDGTELGFDCSGDGTDPSAGNCIADGDGGVTKTSPLLPDTDNGGVSDGDEDVNHNGVVDGEETDPTAGNGADDMLNPDVDGDGLTNDIEISIGTDPSDADSDNDGVPDGQEPSFDQDTDGDGLINALDPDSDGDGLFDGTELGLGCDGPGTDTAAGNCTPDGDGGATTTDPLNDDTDGGGVTDGSEDLNHNGVVDVGESDPNGKDDDVPVDGCTSDAECGDAASGMVCNADTGECEEGCRGKDGNSCPEGEFCSSEDSSIGTCEPKDDIIAQGNGLACATRPASTGREAMWVLAAAAALVFARRRRQQR